MEPPLVVNLVSAITFGVSGSLYKTMSLYLFQNFPQFIVIHTVKGFGIVNKADIDVFLELSCFFHDPADMAI